MALICGMDPDEMDHSALVAHMNKLAKDWGVPKSKIPNFTSKSTEVLRASLTRILKDAERNLNWQ